MNMRNPWRSNRIRNPLTSAFAKDFVGELWEKLQIPADIPGDMDASIDMHDISPTGQASIEELIAKHK